MLLKKNAKIINEKAQVFVRMLNVLCEEDLQITIDELKVECEKELLILGAREVEFNEANIILRVFGEFPDKDFYNIYGCDLIFKGIFRWYQVQNEKISKFNLKDRFVVSYCGMCGDVNTAYPTYKDYYYVI